MTLLKNKSLGNSKAFVLYENYLSSFFFFRARAPQARAKAPTTEEAATTLPPHPFLDSEEEEEESPEGWLEVSGVTEEEESGVEEDSLPP